MTHRTRFSSSLQSRGASLIETLLSIAIIAAILPFAYYRLSETSRDITDISIAQRVIDYKSSMLNFARLNNQFWPNNAQIKISDEDINWITADMGSGADNIRPYVGFIDKYDIKNAETVDIYLAFEIKNADNLRNAKIARAIGADAGVAGDDGIAYGVTGNWAAASQDFVTGDIVYRISVNLSDNGFDKYLHKVETDRGLNQMQRDLYMSNHDIFDAGNLVSNTAEVSQIYANLANAATVQTAEIFFQNGANINPVDTSIGFLRVAGDVVGFRNIYTDKFSGGGTTWSGQGGIVTDRATINNSVNVGKNMYLRSLYSKTVSGFSVISAHMVYAPFVSTGHLNFAPGFGLTISGELLFSSIDAPVKLGNWEFPSNVTAPTFNELYLLKTSSAEVAESLPATGGGFEKITESGWKSRRRVAR